MRPLTSLLLLFLLPVCAYGQGKTSDLSDRARPKIPGRYEIIPNPATRQLRMLGASGQPIPIAVDSADVNGLGKKQALQDQALNKRVLQLSDVSSLTNTAGSLTINGIGATRVLDKNRGGNFSFQPIGSSYSVDNGLVFPASGGGFWVREVQDKRITPQMFGAIPNDNNDDWAGLQAFLQAPGYEHLLPAGRYISSQELSRIDVLNFSLRGAGAQLTVIEFPNDTHGLTIRNTDTGASSYGSILVTGIMLKSTGLKTGSKNALTITSEHYQRPGPVLTNIAIASPVLGTEWGRGIYMYDCSSSSLSGIDVVSSGRTVTTALEFASSLNIPSVENNVTDFNFRNVSHGIIIQSQGTGAGAEGVQISNGSIVNCFQGLVAVANYFAPYIGLSNVHINSFGGECVYLQNYVQCKFSRSLFYSNPGDGVTPSRAVYLLNTTATTGDFHVNTFGNTPYAVEVAGSGGGVDLDVYNIVSSANTITMKVADSFVSGVNVGGFRLWDGNTTWGTTQAGFTQGNNITVSLSIAAKNPAPDDFLQFNGTTYKYEPVSRSLAQRKSTTATVTDLTVNLQQTNAVFVYNGNTNITITVDWASIQGGETLEVIRADNGSGVITVQTSNPTVNKVVQPNQDYLSSYSIPTSVQRNAQFLASSAHLHFLR